MLSEFFKIIKSDMCVCYLGHIKCIDFVISLDKQLTYEDLRIGYANDFGGSSEYSDPADEKKLKAWFLKLKSNLDLLRTSDAF